MSSPKCTIEGLYVISEENCNSLLDCVGREGNKGAKDMWENVMNRLEKENPYVLELIEKCIECAPDTESKYAAINAGLLVYESLRRQAETWKMENVLFKV